MSAQLEDDSSDGDDANLVGLRAIGEDEPLVDPNADTFELDLGAGRRVVIPMDRGAQRRGVAAPGPQDSPHAEGLAGEALRARGLGVWSVASNASALTRRTAGDRKCEPRDA